MNDNFVSYVGLDLHKDSIAIAVAEAGRTAPEFVGTVLPRMSSLCKALDRVCKVDRTLIVYEAGPCGYGWARHLRTKGWACDVIAPARIPRSSSEQRIKTDRRDALLLARESRAGNLVTVAMPDARDEAIRDLCRTRDDVAKARLRWRQQLKAILLRHGLSYQGKSSWTAAHERHLSTISFPHPAQQIAFEEYRQAIKETHERLQRLTEQLREQSNSWRMNRLVTALMCLRGFDFVAATTLVAEIGDPRRFAHPRELMSYLGLVPSEHSSGQSRRQGAITRTGNKHARRLLVEASWNYRHGARISRGIEIRQQNEPKVVRDIAWRAQLRLAKRFRHLSLRRGMPRNKVCIAIARELAGFVWDIARQVSPTI